MALLQLFQTLLLSPLELFFEILFSVSNQMLGSPGWSIVVLSLAMNALALPLYRKADELQREERDREARMRPWTSHIKRYFKGAERFMILRTYYRQNHYKPTDALKGSVSLLLEIPFFIAAYRFLSRLQLLKGVSFGPLADLGAPDRLLTVAGVPVNVLPILMTAINIVSSCVYLKGMSLKSKVQLHGMALIFLVLLYPSPSGLVLYWTLNNLFSLGKNLFYRFKPPRLVVPAALSAAGVLVAVGLLSRGDGLTTKARILAYGLALLLQLPLAGGLLGGKAAALPSRRPKPGAVSFATCCWFLIALTGLGIPVVVIYSSPEEFIDPLLLNNPLSYVLHSLCFAAGAFGVWPMIFYKLASDKARRAMAMLFWVASAVALADALAMAGDCGILLPHLTFLGPDFSPADQVANLAAVLLVAAVALGVAVKWPKAARHSLATLLAAILCLSGYFAVSSFLSIRATTRRLEALGGAAPELSLSRHGKNVVVIMLDRAIGGYVPYLFREKPELERQFRGFTYYPNTLSYGRSTNVGSPALYGGYEYTPAELNRRDSERLVEKQNEALKVMPVLFSTRGYDVTVCDPSYAGYSWIPDLSVYDEFHNIRTFLTMGFVGARDEASAREVVANLKRNFFCYSLVRVAPAFMRPLLYARGTYNGPAKVGAQLRESEGELLRARGVRDSFMQSYSVLRDLPAITRIRDGNRKGSFVMMSNNTTHEPTLLQLPDYLPADRVDNRPYRDIHGKGVVLGGRKLKMETFGQVAHYHANMAAMLQLGKWLDFLRENRVYDNTRIILVADHGYPVRQFDDMVYGDGPDDDAMYMNPLLLVKDFDSHDLRTDETFMTNGDVPTMAVEGLFEEALNPFTGNPISSRAKSGGRQRVLTTQSWRTTKVRGKRFRPGVWYEMGTNVLDKAAWEEARANSFVE